MSASILFPVFQKIASHFFEQSVQARLAQLVEHLVYTEEVQGSSPWARTIASIIASQQIWRDEPRCERSETDSVHNLTKLDFKVLTKLFFFAIIDVQWLI